MATVAWGFVILSAIAVVWLLAHEVQAYRVARRDPLVSSRARRRLVRRATGGVFLLLALFLLRFPATEAMQPLPRLIKMLAVLFLSLSAFLIALHDFYVMRRQVQRDVAGFLMESGQQFQEYLKQASEEDPEAAEQVRRVFEAMREQGESKNPDR